MDQITKLLLETAQRLFAEGCEPELQEAAERGEFQNKLWQAIEDNGLTQALVPESAGGVDLGLEATCAVLRVAGAFALPLPLADTMLATWTLAHAGIEIPDGTMTVVCSDLNGLRINASRRISGVAIGVPWLPAVDHVVVVASESTECKVLLVNRQELAPAMVEGRDLAGEPIGDLDLSRLEGGSLVGEQAKPCRLSAQEIFQTAALMRVCLTAGALDRVLDLCIEHATERIQFGRPVAKFQAVQNLVAMVAGEAAAIGVSAPSAVRAWERDRDSFAVACAKTRSCEAAGKAARIAHQVHAAIGYTQEHILHRFTRRLWSWRDQYGDETHWSLAVGEAIHDAQGDGIWPTLTRYG